MLAPDKILHLKGGALLAALLLAVVAVARFWGPGFAIALGCSALAIGVERYQEMRNEGTPSLADAATSASPGLVFGLLLEAWLRSRGAA